MFAAASTDAASIIIVSPTTACTSADVAALCGRSRVKLHKPTLSSKLYSGRRRVQTASTMTLGERDLWNICRGGIWYSLFLFGKTVQT